jgi:class 3 adenylate cyclase/tetratricopeptide (TPR) repeat protein
MSKPRPLPTHLESAVERLAELVHQAWVEHRISQGWTFGARHDESALRSPRLVPYTTLNEADRELDRVTVRRALGGLTELGYRIEGDAPLIGAADSAPVLHEAEQLIARGRPLPAYDLTKRLLATYPANARLLLLNARALRRCGALWRALTILEGISGPDVDGERRGLLAAVHKEIFLRGQAAGTDPRAHLRVAQQLYQEVFDESTGQAYWHGINAATLAFVLGHESVARELAERVLRVCERTAGSATDYWLPATRGEATLLLGRFREAAKDYRAAVAIAGERIGDIAAMRRNAVLLLATSGAEAADRREIEEALRPPSEIVFAGPLIDRDERTPGGFPAAIEADVRAALRERLQQLNGGFGFSGAAPGAELMFVELMLERSPGVANVVLPWPRTQFVETHVRAAGTSWEQRFAALLGSESQVPRVQHVVSATLGVGLDAPLYEDFACQLLFGLAKLQARTLGTSVVPLVVWNGGVDRDQRGHVAELAERWATQGVTLGAEHIVDIGPMLKRDGRRRIFVSTAPPAPAATPAAFRVMAILFADVEDYSSIAENRLPNFIEYFIGGIGSRLAVRPHKPVNVRRVGDGLLMVFAGVRDAASCALDLVEWATEHSRPAPDGATFWSRLGLPAEMRLRVALHAGPVFECVDPLTHATTFEGAHINYAARIEPVTPGNNVFASEAFAALAASWPSPCPEFACEYVGRTSLAKKFGEYPLYHVRRC